MMASILIGDFLSQMERLETPLVVGGDRETDPVLIYLVMDYLKKAGSDIPSYVDDLVRGRFIPETYWKLSKPVIPYLPGVLDLVGVDMWSEDLVNRRYSRRKFELLFESDHVTKWIIQYGLHEPYSSRNLMVGCPPKSDDEVRLVLQSRTITQTDVFGEESLLPFGYHLCLCQLIDVATDRYLVLSRFRPILPEDEILSLSWVCS